MQSETFLDTVYAIPAEKTAASKYSTVLYAEDLAVAENIGVNGTSPSAMHVPYSNTYTSDSRLPYC